MPEELFSGNPSLADLEKRYIERTLEQSGWRIEGKEGSTRRAAYKPIRIVRQDAAVWSEKALLRTDASEGRHS